MNDLMTAPPRQQQPMHPGYGSMAAPLPQHQGQAAQQALNRPNPFVTAATPLLTLMNQIKRTQTHPDVNKLRAQIVNEIKLYEQKLTKLRINPRHIIATRYCLCTAIDEAVLATTWGTQSIWVQQSLLSLFQKETYGGERFYIILENMVKEPRKNLDIIELLYLLLSLGFEGKFFDKGNMVREEIRSRVFQRIRQSKGKVAKRLSGHWRDAKPIAVNKQKRTALRRIVIITGAGLLLLNLIFNYETYKHAAPTLNRLSAIGKESPVTVYSQMVKRTIFPKDYN